MRRALVVEERVCGGWYDQIDEHDAVLRINYAPYLGFEADVGSKTTFDFSNRENARRMLKSHVRFLPISPLARPPSAASSETSLRFSRAVRHCRMELPHSVASAGAARQSVRGDQQRS